MLELIFQGLIQWIYGLIMEIWNYFVGVLFDLISMDFTYLEAHIPVIPEIAEVLVAVGWALLMGNLVFQALKSMLAGIGFEAEDPALLFTRTFMFSFLLLVSPELCQIGLSMTQIIIDLLEVPMATNIVLVDESIFGTLSAAWLLVIICGIFVMIHTLKLAVEIGERYIILAFLTLCAPLAFSMGGSKATTDIFTGWCRMFGSMCFVMVSNMIFLKMLLSVLSTVPSGLDVFPWMVLVFGIVKVAKKIDGIITRIGLNPAITGDSLGRAVPGMLSYMVMRSATNRITKAAGNTAPSSGGNPSSTSRATNPFSQKGSGGLYTQTSQASQQQTSQNTGFQHSVTASQSTQTTQSGQTTQGAQPTQSNVTTANTTTSAQSNNQYSPSQSQSRIQNQQTGQTQQSRQSAVPFGQKQGSGYTQAPNAVASTMSTNNAIGHNNSLQSQQATIAQASTHRPITQTSIKGGNQTVQSPQQTTNHSESTVENRGHGMQTKQTQAGNQTTGHPRNTLRPSSVGQSNAMAGTPPPVAHKQPPNSVAHMQPSKPVAPSPNPPNVQRQGRNAPVTTIPTSQSTAPTIQQERASRSPTIQQHSIPKPSSGTAGIVVPPIDTTRRTTSPVASAETLAKQVSPPPATTPQKQKKSHNSRRGIPV